MHLQDASKVLTASKTQGRLARRSNEALIHKYQGTEASKESATPIRWVSMVRIIMQLRCTGAALLLAAGCT